MQTAYLEAIAFTESDEIEHAQWADSAIAAARNACEHFIGQLDAELLAIVSNNPTQAGHDVWFDRNGHGVGFWDRPEIYGDGAHDRLSTIATDMGESLAYLGDDGLAYLG